MASREADSQSGVVVYSSATTCQVISLMIDSYFLEATFGRSEGSNMHPPFKEIRPTSPDI